MSSIPNALTDKETQRAQRKDHELAGIKNQLKGPDPVVAGKRESAARLSGAGADRKDE